MLLPTLGLISMYGIYALPQAPNYDENPRPRLSPSIAVEVLGQHRSDRCRCMVSAAASRNSEVVRGTRLRQNARAVRGNPLRGRLHRFSQPQWNGSTQGGHRLLQWQKGWAENGHPYLSSKRCQATRTNFRRTQLLRKPLDSSRPRHHTVETVDALQRRARHRKQPSDRRFSRHQREPMGS